MEVTTRSIRHRQSPRRIAVARAIAAACIRRNGAAPSRGCAAEWVGASSSYVWGVGVLMDCNGALLDEVLEGRVGLFDAVRQVRQTQQVCRNSNTATNRSPH